MADELHKLSIFLTILCLIQGIICKDYHPVATYFRKLDAKGNLVDANDPKNRATFNFLSPKARYVPLQIDSAVFQVEPSLLDNNQNATLSWCGVENPNAKDIVALYCPVTTEAERYLDFFYVPEMSKTWQNGTGSYVIPLFNLRTDCEFRYYRNDGFTYLVATSNKVSFRGGPEQPLQGHISLTGNPTQMRIMWVSGTDAKPLVRYGIDSSIPLFAEGISSTYNASDMCAAPATVHFIDPGFIHNVLLEGLKPSTTYYYSYGVPGRMTTVRTFTTAPLVGPEVAFKFIAYGDMGPDVPPGGRQSALSPGSEMTAKWMMHEVAEGSRFILHNGDISYARGYAYIWDQWHDLIEPYATLIPYMVGIGNHEQDHESGGSKDPSGAPGEGWHPVWGNYGTDSGGECGVPMFKRFHMPDNGNALWWYSFDYGSVHVVMMSSEHDFSLGSRQYTWLENDLKNVDRSRTPWVVLTAHRAMYSSRKERGDYLVSIGMRYFLEDLLYKYKVDLALWAHYHSYERTCQVYKEICTKGAPVHIVVGTAGKNLDLGYDWWPMKWSLSRMNEFGYGRITVANSSAMHWEFVLDKNREVIDEVWITK